MKYLNYLNFCLVFLFISIISAQNTNISCQYTELKETNNFIQVVYDKDGNKYENSTSIENIQGNGNPAGVGIPVSFDIKNNIPYVISFKVTYNLHHSGGGNWVGEKNFTIGSFEKQTISDIVSIGWGSAWIDNINIIYFSNDNLEVKSEKVKEQICKQCNGINCLNDGQNCISDVQCGSGICNIRGICGTQKIVECSTDFRNCNNESCLEVRIKNVGEKYSCEFECETNYGENGICKTSLPVQIFKGIFIFVFVLIGCLIIYLIFTGEKLFDIIRRKK